MIHHKPPSLLEIMGLQPAGAARIEVLHTRENDLILFVVATKHFVVPFLIAVVRLFVAQFQVPAGWDPTDEDAACAARLSVAINQVAAFVLISVESGGLIASDRPSPALL